MDYTKEQLQAMKRADLQKLCKKFGIKANIKTERMVEELTEYSNTTNEAVVNEPVNTTEEAKNETEELTNPDNPPVKRKSDNKRRKPQVKASSKIPRLTGKPERRNVDCKTPIMNGKSKTPKRSEPKDWSKIHQKQFEKMDSLDVYLTKKRKRAEQLGSAAKRVKGLTELEKPKIITKVIKPQNHTQAKSVPAKPKSTAVTPKPKEGTLNSTKRLTFNFLPKAKENQTPSGAEKRRTTLNEATHKPATPFRFTSNTMPFGSPTPRNKFDLKASLAKPLNYTPYRGKLPTPPYVKHSPKVAVKKNAGKSHQRDVKAVKTKTRNERRAKQLKSQSRARESAVSRRRGMVN